MPEYDVKDVHLYIKDVMALTERQRVALWYQLVYASDLSDAPSTMVHRFRRHCAWTQANILFRFGPIIDKIVREEAVRFTRAARIEDGENA